MVNCLDSLRALIAEYFPEKSIWCSVEQARQGVERKAHWDSSKDGMLRYIRTFIFLLLLSLVNKSFT